jgi:hypothetical protein
MDDAEEYALVVKAFQLACGAHGYVTGYVEWSERGANDSRRNLSELGLTPEGIRELAIEHVRAGGPIVQVRETEEGRDRPYYYKIILAVPGVPQGVFVKIRLIDEDPDDPAVLLVSAHRQGV